ncbi:MAG: glycosyltransferase family 2 protein [Polyangiaceae bacterium]
MTFSPCIVVPARQAERSLGEVLGGLARALPDVPPAAVLVVVDGPGDGTAREAARHGATVVLHEENRGKGAALRTGLLEAAARGYDVALSVDADGQHPAESARIVLDASPDPTALVLGVRDLVRDGAPRANQISNGISNAFLSAFSGTKLADTQCGLRRYPVRETLALGVRATGYAFEAEVILRAIAAGFPLVEVGTKVHYPPEHERVTYFHSVKDPTRIVGTVVSTVLALRAAKLASWAFAR